MWEIAKAVDERLERLLYWALDDASRIPYECPHLTILVCLVIFGVVLAI